MSKQEACRVILVALAALASVLSANAVGASGDGPAALVIRVSCAANACAVVHAGQMESVRPFMPLYAGDVVKVNSVSAVVEIGTSEQRSARVTAATGPYDVGAARQPNGLLTRLWGEVAHEFTQQQVTEASAAAREVAIHAPPVRVCVNSHPERPFRIAAGTRKLALPLVGGNGSFRLTVRDSLGHVLAQSALTSGNWIVAGPVAVAPGTLEFVVEDVQTGTTVHLGADVVATGVAPATPAALHMAGLSDHAERELRFAWLVSEQNGVWSLETAAEAAEAAPDASMPPIFAMYCR